jgi:transposase-like protein
VVNDTIKRKLVQRALMPGASRLTDISRQSGVPYNTLWKWVQKAKLAGVSQQPPKSEPPAQRPDDRTPQDKLRIVLAAAGLPDEENCKAKAAHRWEVTIHLALVIETPDFDVAFPACTCGTSGKCLVVDREPEVFAAFGLALHEDELPLHSVVRWNELGRLSPCDDLRSNGCN